MCSSDDAVARQAGRRVADRLSQRLGERRRIEQLRADMAVDADAPRCLAGRRRADRAARRPRRRRRTCCSLSPGRDVRVRLGVDVRIDAQADRRRFGRGGRDCVQAVEFGGRFDVEAEYAGGERMAHFVRGACRRRRKPSCADRRRRRARASVRRRKRCRNRRRRRAKRFSIGEVGVGLDGVADERIDAPSSSRRNSSSAAFSAARE